MWRDGGQLRIFLNSRHRLFSLDAATGKPVPRLATNGAVSLIDGLPRIGDITHVTQSSPPVVYKDLVIVGSQVPDRVQLPDPVGLGAGVRRPHRQARVGVLGHSAVGEGSGRRDVGERVVASATATRNVWAPMALDEARGLLYLPTSTPSSDYYGGQRPGANLFAESLVCLDAATGKMKWHFQTVHHGLWDWDIPAQPNLVTITVDGKRIDAVAQVTKRGDTFVFDRVTGKPVWPIVERPVPTDSDVPGEKPYPTQPFPTKPPAFVAARRDARRREQPDAGNQGAGAGADAEVPHRPDVHAALARAARCSGRRQAGGANWGGAAFDPETGYLFVRAQQRDRRQRASAKNDGSDPLVEVDYSNMFGRRRGGEGRRPICPAACRWFRRPMRC